MTTHRPRKRFGQHFLTDPGVVNAILDAISAGPDDAVVEIGPGRGAMTRALARQAGSLHTIEIDRDLAAALAAEYADDESVVIHEADALQFDFASLGNELRIVGNLPYNISTPLLFRLLEFRDALTDMHFMLQKEVVDRMAAEPGSKTYGRLTVMLGSRFDIEALFEVPPNAFDPPPDVRSAVVRLVPLPEGTYDIDDQDSLSKLAAQAFSQRRKTIRNSLKGLVDVDALEFAGIDPGLRAEAIPIDAYVRLANTLE